nr:universal stress protein [Streptomyces sp. TRM70350]
MTRTIIVGLDGSPESRAAAEWAAREAKLRCLPLKLLHVWEPVPEPMAQAPPLGTETHRHWTHQHWMHQHWTEEARDPAPGRPVDQERDDHYGPGGRVLHPHPAADGGRRSAAHRAVGHAHLPADAHGGGVRRLLPGRRQRRAQGRARRGAARGRPRSGGLKNERGEGR